MTMVVPSTQPSLRSSSKKASLTLPLHEWVHSIPTRGLWSCLSFGSRREDKQYNQKDRHRSGKSSHSITVSSQRNIRDREAERLGPEKSKL